MTRDGRVHDERKMAFLCLPCWLGGTLGESEPAANWRRHRHFYPYFTGHDSSNDDNRHWHSDDREGADSRKRKHSDSYRDVIPMVVCTRKLKPNSSHTPYIFFLRNAGLVAPFRPTVWAGVSGALL